MYLCTSIDAIASICPQGPMDPEDHNGPKIEDHFIADAQGIPVTSVMDGFGDFDFCKQDYVEITTEYHEPLDGQREGVYRVFDLTIRDPKIGAPRCLEVTDYFGLEERVIELIHGGDRS